MSEEEGTEPVAAAEAKPVAVAAAVGGSSSGSSSIGSSGGSSGGGSHSPFHSHRELLELLGVQASQPPVQLGLS